MSHPPRVVKFDTKNRLVTATNHRGETRTFHHETKEAFYWVMKDTLNKDYQSELWVDGAKIQELYRVKGGLHDQVASNQQR